MARKTWTAGSKKPPRPLRVVDNHEPDLGDILLGEIDDRTERLSKELRKFTREVKKAEPDCDDRAAFESWTVQKIAGLQILFEWHEKRFTAERMGRLIMGKAIPGIDVPDESQGN